LLDLQLSDLLPERPSSGSDNRITQWMNEPPGSQPWNPMENDSKPSFDAVRQYIIAYIARAKIILILIVLDDYVKV
jgi:hypothetical protein